MTEDYKIRGGMSPEEATEYFEEEGARGKPGGGGKKKRKDSKVRAAIRRATKRKREHTQDRGKEKRVEKEHKPSLEKHLGEAIKREGDLEPYLDWLVSVLDDSKFVLDEKTVKYSFAAPGGAGGAGKDTSNSACRARHPITGEDSRIQASRSNNKLEARRVLRAKVKVWADRWRKYEEEAGEGAALTLFDKVTGYQS